MILSVLDSLETPWMHSMRGSKKLDTTSVIGTWGMMEGFWPMLDCTCDQCSCIEVEVAYLHFRGHVHAIGFCAVFLGLGAVN